MKKKLIIIALILIVLFFVIFIFTNRQSAGERQNGLSVRDFFPFGRTSETDTPRPTTPQNGLGQTEERPIAPAETFLTQLRKISERPIAGATVFNLNGETLFRFVDRATGHIWEGNVETSGLGRVSNTTIPKIQEAVWAGPNNVILRFLKEDRETVESVSLRLLTAGAETGTVASGYEFTSELRQGSTGAAVLNLQRILNQDPDTRIASTGAGSPGLETTIFGPATRVAVEKFQEKYTVEILTPQNLTEPTGIVDELTREKLNEITGAKKPAEVTEDGNEDEFYRTALNFLPTDIKNLIYLPNLNKIFYLLEDASGSVGFLANPDGSQRQQIFESPAREWRASGINGQGILIQTKPSFLFPGLAYILNSNGEMRKILDGIFGLSALISPDVSKAVYSGSTQGRISFNLFDLNGRQTSDLSDFGGTFPEKCVWSKKNPIILYCAMPEVIPEGFAYPDSWYQGAISFSDALWEINVSDGRIFPLSQLENIDATNLFLDETEKFIFFTNKNDYSLWVFELQ